MAFKNELQFIHLYRNGEIKVLTEQKDIEEAIAQGWNRYEREQHLYPKTLYKELQSRVVNSKDEESVLGKEWKDRPSAEWMNAQDGYNEVPEVRVTPVQLQQVATAPDKRVAQLEAQLEAQGKLLRQLLESQNAQTVSAPTPAAEPAVKTVTISPPAPGKK